MKPTRRRVEVQGQEIQFPQGKGSCPPTYGPFPTGQRPCVRHICAFLPSLVLLSSGSPQRPAWRGRRKQDAGLSLISCSQVGIPISETGRLQEHVIQSLWISPANNEPGDASFVFNMNVCQDELSAVLNTWITHFTKMPGSPFWTELESLQFNVLYSSIGGHLHLCFH